MVSAFPIFVQIGVHLWLTPGIDSKSKVSLALLQPLLQKGLL